MRLRVANGRLVDALKAPGWAEHSKSKSSQNAARPSSVPSCKSLSSSEDGPSGHSSLLDGELARNLQDNIRHRILYLSEQLRVEKASRDENTVSYLKLVSKADRHQAPHIRQAFEKVNQRTSATIAQIERKLRQYHQQLQELEEKRRPRSPVNNCEQPSQKTTCSETSKPDRKVALATHQSAVTQQRALRLKKMKVELVEIKKLHLSLQVSCENLKEKYQADLQLLLETLQERKHRQQMMEGQGNGHLQGYLNEIYHLKQNLACTEEKMVYLSYERAKEIWEVLETFKSRIAKLETLQQVAQLEMTEKLRSRPKELLFRFISLLLTLATIILIFISTVCSCPWPSLNPRLRTCTSLVLIGLGALAWQKRHVIFTTDWQAWVMSKWPLSEGP
ncbi:PREDICTED: testis-specific protein TEX28 [Chrysochloris asiatica]|uniref:Testis-specific protein TEX28 n=1 Tax=Chrysochloris asiatica TaxID=185453 RepID=A0A9B0X2D0_CHRAS|nr:PREDICTED: testis-specific protein TEX28 [Chrysochloris asiatica]